MEKIELENWLNHLKDYWYQKDVEGVSSLFQKTIYYQETPFDKPYTTYEEIKNEWEHIKNQDIKKIEFKILAIEGKTAIIEWFFQRDIHEFNGIYEIKFNNDNDCISFRSWEMENK